MRDLSESSIGVGRWLGIPVRLHYSWFIVALFVMYVATHGPGAGHGAYGVLCLLIWFGCVVWHEAWHCVTVARANEITESIVLTPIGGLAKWSTFSSPRSEIFAAGAGGFGNAFGMVLSACMIYAVSGRLSWQLLNPLYPVGLIGDGGPLLAAANMAFWVNWVLLLINVMPTTSTDGGRILNALMWSYRHQRQLSDGLVLSSTLVVMFGLVVLAIILRDAPANVAVPAWLPLIGLALFFGFHALDCARDPGREEELEDVLGYDFSQGYTSLEQQVDRPAKPAPNFLQSWFARRRQRKELERQHQAHEDDLRADVILARLHREGIESLSPEDRALLDRVSARYRERIEE